MLFEEAICALRQGALIRHPMMELDEYLMACRLVSIGAIPIEEKPISIVKMKGEEIHPDMRPRLPFTEQMELLDKHPFLKEKITFPTINLLLIMSDDWEITNI